MHASGRLLRMIIFQGRVEDMCVHNDFYLIWEFLCFGLSEKALSHVILGLLILDQSFSVFGLRERECMSNSVYECVCFMTLSY